MKILVNTRLLISNKLDGIGWFTFETLKRLVEKRATDTFIFVFDRPFSKNFVFAKNVIPVVIGPPARHPFLWFWWFEWSLKKVIKKYEPHLILSPDGYVNLQTNIKQLAVIHDINFEHYPQYLPYFYRNYYRYFFPKFAQKATRISTVSEFSKNDLVKTYKVNAQKIDVVYNGYNTNYKPLEMAEIELTRQKFSNNAPYFLFIGTLHPRKNITRLLLAFNKFKSLHNTNNFKLLIVGEKLWFNNKMKTTYENMAFKNDVVFLGRLNPEVLAQVIASAYAITYVSVFEGFGIPILEGMASGVPVVTSNTSSMPEVGAQAALYCNPLSVESIYNALIEITQNKTLYYDLKIKGLERAAQFSWDNTTDLLNQSIEKLINHD